MEFYLGQTFTFSINHQGPCPLFAGYSRGKNIRIPESLSTTFWCIIIAKSPDLEIRTPVFQAVQPRQTDFSYLIQQLNKKMWKQLCVCLCVCKLRAKVFLKIGAWGDLVYVSTSLTELIPREQRAQQLSLKSTGAWSFCKFSHFYTFIKTLEQNITAPLKTNKTSVAATGFRA